jgi:hypothetical protein
MSKVVRDDKTVVQIIKKEQGEHEVSAKWRGHRSCIANCIKMNVICTPKCGKSLECLIYI